MTGIVGAGIVTMAASGCASAIPTHTRKHHNGLGAPRLISLSYGRYRPQGAPHAYLALRLKAITPGGQILEAKYEASSGAMAIGDSECGIGGRRNGQVEIFYTPFALRRGQQEVQVIVTADSCTTSTRTRTTSRTFRIIVPRSTAATKIALPS